MKPEIHPIRFFIEELAKIAEGLPLFFSACSALSAVNLWFGFDNMDFLRGE